MTRLAVILAGGEGRRMGGCKPLRPYGVATLIGHALGLARRYAPTVAVAVRDPVQVGRLDAPLLMDDPGVPGPLAGLASALSHAQAIGADAVLTLPCDMPQLPPDLMERLRRALAEAPGALAAVATSGERLHPVCALWRPQALDRLPAYLAQGRSSLRGFAGACGAVTEEWEAFDEDPFANANTPEELAALQPARQAA